jgi:hypothetical protein
MCPVPFSAAISSRRAAFLAVLWAPSIRGMNLLWLLVTHRQTPEAAIPCVLAMVIWALVAHRAFACRSLAHAIAWLVCGALLAGGMDLWFWEAPLAHRVPRAALAYTLEVYAVAGPLLQAAYNALFGAMVWTYVAAPSHESSDQAVVVASVWIALPWVMSLSAGLLESSRASDVLMNKMAIHLFVTVPLALGTWSVVRTIRRRRWLHEVQRGHSPGWRLDEWDGALGKGLPALVFDRTGAPSKIIMRVHSGLSPIAGEKDEPLGVIGSDGKKSG